MASDLMHVLMLATISCSAALLVALALRKPLRRRFGARRAYALWSLVPLAALVPLLPAPVRPIAAQISTPAPEEILSGLPPVAMAPASVDLSMWLTAAWLLGAIVAAALLARQQRRFVRALGRLARRADGTFRAQATAGCPALLGVWRSRIVVPADFEQRYGAGERELILAHERTHRRHGDAQLNAVAAALRCVFWFNPLVHFGAALFRFDQELACDAAVIARFPGARRCYADAMLKAQLAESGLPVGCHWHSHHPLRDRIALIKQPLPGRLRAAAGGIAVAALVAGGTVAVWAGQPSVPVRVSDQQREVAARAVASAPRADTSSDRIALRDPSAVPVPQSMPLPARTSAVQVSGVDAAARAPMSPRQRKKPALSGSGGIARVAPAAPAGAAASDRPRDAAPSPLVADATARAAGQSNPAKPTEGDNAARAAPFVPPRVTRRWRAAYPEEAYLANEQGVAQVLVTIAADGSLKDARTYASSGSRALDKASLEAARRYSYSAAAKGGVAIEAQAIVAIDWSIAHPDYVETIASGMTRKTGF